MSEATQNQIASLREASRKMVRELGMLEASERSLRVTHTECHILIELGTAGRLTVNELALLLNLDKSTVSRAVDALNRRKLVAFDGTSADRRKKPIKLTAQGQNRLEIIHQSANSRVANALCELTPEKQAQVIDGLALYAKALRLARSKSQMIIEPLSKKYSEQMGMIVRKVLGAYVGDRPGFANGDAELNNLEKSYRAPRCSFWIVREGDQVLGGAGIAPLAGGGEKICELRKMYLLPEARGLGLGKELLTRCLQFAKAAKYDACYLETLCNMHEANALYDQFGFKDLSSPKGNTGHSGCDRWRQLELTGTDWKWRPG